MKELLTKTKRVLLGGTALSILAGVIALAPSAHASTISAISLSGSNITAQATTVNANLGSADAPLTVSFTTSTALNSDGQYIKIALDGLAKNRNLTASDLVFMGCTSSNTLEEKGGANNNGVHEVTIENSNKLTVLLSLDTTKGTLDCPAGTYTLTLPEYQASQTAGNYAISVTTSIDFGTSLLYVGSTSFTNTTGTVTTVAKIK